MARFTLPRDLYFGAGAMNELKCLKGYKKAFIVTGGSSTAAPRPNAPAPRLPTPRRRRCRSRKHAPPPAARYCRGRRAGRCRQSVGWRCSPWPRPSQPVQRARHPAPALVQHIRVDHRRADIGMAQQLLHGTDVLPSLQQVRGE